MDNSLSKKLNNDMCTIYTLEYIYMYIDVNTIQIISWR